MNFGILAQKDIALREGEVLLYTLLISFFSSSRKLRGRGSAIIWLVSCLMGGVWVISCSLIIL
jgi:hypothetical protein